MYPLLIVLGLVLIFILWVVGKFNSLITLRNQTINGWKQIDVQLKRRHDLIPNLVNTVKGLMEFEQDTLQRLFRLTTLQSPQRVSPTQQQKRIY